MRVDPKLYRWPQTSAMRSLPMNLGHTPCAEVARAKRRTRSHICREAAASRACCDRGNPKSGAHVRGIHDRCLDNLACYAVRVREGRFPERRDPTFSSRIASEDEASVWTHRAAPACHDHVEEARSEALEKDKQISEVRLT